jgi:predicted Rdx family selenoprotein
MKTWTRPEVWASRKSGILNLKLNFKGEIMNFLSKIKLVMSAIFNELLPYIKTFFTRYGAVVLALATEVVMELAKDNDMSWSEKRDTAFNQVGDKLVQQGIAIGVDVSKTLILNSIQAAASKLQEMEK